MAMRSLSEALFVSVAIHALAAYSLYTPGATHAPDSRSKKDSVTVSLVKETPPKPKPAAIPTKKLTEERLKRIAQYQKKLPAAPAKVQTPAIPKPVKTTTLATRPLVPKPAGSSVTRTSGELLMDPVKGKIFSNYFSGVKDKIHQALRQKYSRVERGEGKVSLFFILDADGQVETVSVLQRESLADLYVKELAQTAVVDAAPFGRFPAELALDKVAFSVTVYFEEI
jgi:outer membrane biosynthesis protein TonB